MESRRPDALIKDEKAEQLVRRIDYDFSRIMLLRLNKTDQLIFILRCRQFDRYTRDFMDRHSDAVVVHLACGFDTRSERVDNGQVEWFDLDLPEIANERRKLFGDEGHRYYLLGCSALDKAWLEAISEHDQFTEIID